MIAATAIELIRAIRDEHWLDLPGKDNLERRSRCNEIIEWMDDLLDTADQAAAEALSNPALARLLSAEPTAAILTEAARRLDERPLAQ